MTIEETLAELEAAGTQQNRKVFARHGVNPPQFGVSYAILGRLTKRIKRDQPLAEALWATGIHDARVLATMIADPLTARPEVIRRWASDLDSYVTADALAKFVALRADVLDWIAVWTPSENDWIGQAGWNLVAHVALKREDLDDGFLEMCLDDVAAHLSSRKNRTRYAMNGALIAIGLRDERLRVRAQEVARRIGKVDVDHGETGCKTPDAHSYIEKGWSRRETARPVRVSGSGKDDSSVRR